ncbi:hypothetical protein CMZ82_12410 [Lysobacteraceae bacterium NML93-0792]|nr:hypothetical protein CMZ82_12410 [Xanthomonadaceae bacterium NML93-0792]PBS16163.1 hypothetical protein CMZ81_07540 [Xanthomonadaceae bacterium NML93-0793]PBS20189.1 hypothetical protein CMZ80_04305 [Xanthomonadaceae bacterium NML93-0831]
MTAPQTHETPAGTGVSKSAEASGFDTKASAAVERMQPDFAEAERFLTLLDESAEAFCFRTFPEIGEGHGANHPGALDAVADALQRDNARGRGVYVVVNEGGNKAAEITRVRAVFADFDPPKTSPMPEPGAFPLEPHIMVESSPGKHHVYWLVDGLPLDEFTPTQEAIVARYGSDASVCDRPRVMRVPGFIHRKAEPFRARIIHESGALPYTAEAIRAAFPAVAVKPKEAAPAIAHAPSGVVVNVDRHADALDLTGRMAREVARGTSEDAAWAMVLAERERGRWTREVTDGELRRMFDGALTKLRSGEWSAPAASAPAANDAEHGEYLDMARVDDEPPPRRAVIGDYLPLGVPVLLAADGGVGKSLLTQQIATAVASGVNWLGNVQEPGPVLCYYCEDPLDELHRRQRGINARLGIESGIDLAGRLFLQSRVGMDSTLMGFDRNGNPIEHPFLAYVEAEVARIRPKLLILDNLAQMMLGDLSDTPSATRFANRMAKIAQTHELTVLMLAHTPKSGAEYYGAAAWNNAVRVRWFMEAEVEPDPVNPARTKKTGRVFLSRPKANWGKQEGAVAMRWSDNAFVLDGGACTLADAVERGNRHAEVEGVVIAGLRKLLEIGLNTSEKPQAGNYLPKVLASYELDCSVSRKELGEAMRRLIKAGTVLPGQELGRRTNRAAVIGLGLVDDLAAAA